MSQQNASPGRSRLRLNRDDRKVLGVCAGFADYLDVPAALVRVIYLIACLVSPVLIIAYFVLYWLMKEEDQPSKIRVYVSESETAQHFRRIDYRKPLYRNTERGKIGGVCAGIADYLGISTLIVRLVTLASLFILGAVTLWVYVACWIVLDRRPRNFRYANAHDPDTAAAGATGPDMAAEDIDTLSLQRCAEVLQSSERRLREVEAYMTSRQFRLHCEINRIQR